MSVLRWLRIFLPLVLVALLVAAVVLVFSSRNDLRQARARVDASWTPLRDKLDARYAVLHTAFANDSVKSVPGPVHAIVENTATTWQHWRDLLTHQGSVADEVATANDLEAAGRRLVHAVRAAPRLQNNQSAQAAITKYANTALPNVTVIADFEHQAERFQKLRDRPANRLAARVLGYAAIPDYDTTTSG